MKGRTQREQCLAEFSIAVTLGGILAIILCMVLPGIETKADVGMLIMPFWFCVVITVWEIIDTAEVIMKERRRKNGRNV